MHRLLLAALGATLLVAVPFQVRADGSSSSKQDPLSQQQHCQKLAMRVNRLKASKQGPSMANRAYAAGITKLSRRYGYNPCPGLRAPNV